MNILSKLHCSTASKALVASVVVSPMLAFADGVQTGTDMVANAADKLGTLGISLASLGAVAATIYLVFVSIGAVKRAMGKIA